MQKKKKELCLALIIQTPRKLKRNDGRFIKFSEHKCIILNRKYKILDMLNLLAHNSDFVKNYANDNEINIVIFIKNIVK